MSKQGRQPKLVQHQWMLILWPSRKAKERTPKEKVKIVGVKEKVKARKEKAKEEKTKAKDLGTKTPTVKVGTLTTGIRTLGATAKAKERTKEVAAVETSEVEGSSPQPEPEITALFVLEEEMAEHPHRSRSVRTSGGQLPEGDESEKSLMSRLEKIQHQMNRSAIHGLDVDQELVDAQQAIYASLKALRAKTLEQEAKERRAASAPAPARDSRLQQDIDSGMHPRAAKRAEKNRQRAEDHQRSLAEEKASKTERAAKSRSRRSSPRRESRPEGRHPSPRRHRAGKDRSDRKRRQKSEEKDQLTVEEEEDLIRVQLEEVHESPAVKEQIARVLREAYRERFRTDPEPGSSSKRPSRSHKDPVDELDDLPSSELDELEEKYGQSIEVTSEGQARLKGSERQEKERLEKAKPAIEMVGKVSREEYERQMAATKEIERERRKEYEKEKREQLEREKKEAKAIKEINPKKEELRTSAPVKVRPNPPEDVPHWINASDGSLKSFREVHRLSPGRHLRELLEMSTNNPRIGTLQPMGPHRVEGLLPGQRPGWMAEAKEGA